MESHKLSKKPGIKYRGSNISFKVSPDVPPS